MNLREFLQTQPRRWLVCEALAVVLLVGCLDYLTGREVTLFLLYALPIFMVAWYGSRNWALVIAFLSAATWWLANLETHPFVTGWGYTLAALTRLGYCLFVAIGGAALRLQHDASQARIEMLEMTRVLEKQILRASEHAQQQIGQELHDGICQYFAAVACAAKSLKDDLESRAVAEAAAAGEIECLVNAGVVQIRNLARGIFPVQMDEAGLPAALEDLVATANHLMPVTVSFKTSGEISIQDPQVSMHFYRIAQEALNNAVKHGNAQHIDISLVRDDVKIVLTVSDDGRGFPKNAPASGGMGLKTMQYRAHAIGANLTVDSCDNPGATLICTMPFRESPPNPLEYVRHN